ncbi:hypothetical protein NE865_03298 [Phthorimaea operculella]|nr:hypothetical protein NE865_03298 [Phthorimaea operculella]
MQVNNIQTFLANFTPSQDVEPQAAQACEGMALGDSDHDVLDANVSGELYDPECDQVSENADQSAVLPVLLPLANETPAPCSNTVSGSHFSLPVNTVIKEPTVGKTLPYHLEKLKAVQHFETDDWSEVRYADVQKNYSSTPGFVELECNDEFKSHESSLNLNHTERGFAAISQALLKQNEALEQAIRSFVLWLGSVEITDTASVESKMTELLTQSDYQKISSDLLQMTCGHRADMVQQRRDNLLKSVKNKFVKAAIRKIPPTASHLFKSDELSAVIEKNGGSGKIFWPSKDTRTKKSVTFDTRQSPLSASPAQGQGQFPFPPAQGVGSFNMMPPHGTMGNPFLHPPQGVFPNMPGMVMPPFLPRNPVQGRIFRPRGTRPSQENRLAPKQYSVSANRDNRNKKKF